MKEIFIVVRGGMVQGVRTYGMPRDIAVTVLDFDELYGSDNTEDDYIFDHSPFNSWEQLEERTDAIY